MKIPERYGGLGLRHAEYVRAMTLVGSYDANVTALLSAHQAIGVPQPLMLFGTEEQRERFLPRCAAGAISAFALTEPAVGSDPARLATEARRSDDGSHYVLLAEDNRVGHRVILERAGSRAGSQARAKSRWPRTASDEVTASC